MIHLETGHDHYQPPSAHRFLLIRASKFPILRRGEIGDRPVPSIFVCRDRDPHSKAHEKNDNKFTAEASENICRIRLPAGLCTWLYSFVGGHDCKLQS